MKRLNTVLLALGLGFLLYLIHKSGWRQLWQQFSSLGWGLTLIILAEGMANLAHTIGWRHCIPQFTALPEDARPASEHPQDKVPIATVEPGSVQKPLSIWQLFRMNMAGWAINYLTPTASLGGEVTRSALLAPRTGASKAIASVFLDKLMTAIAHVGLVIAGAAFLIFRIHLPPQLWIAMTVTSVLLIGGIVGFVVIQSRGGISQVCRWLTQHDAGKRYVVPFAGNLSRVDAVLKEFYRKRPRELFLSVFWHGVGHCVAFVHVWLFFRLLNQSTGLHTIVAAACLALWFDLLTFAVPLNLGTLEGSRGVALQVLGCRAMLGITFGMAIRAAQLFWACFGLAAYAFSTVKQDPHVHPARVARRNRTRKDFNQNICMEELT